LEIPELRAKLESLTRQVEAVRHRLDALRDEQVVLPTYLEPLRLLLSLVPVLARLDVAELRQIGLATAVVVLNTDDERLVDAIRVELVEEFDARFELASTPVDEGAIGCLVVFPVESSDVVHSILGGSAIRSVSLPERFEGLALNATVAAMQRRVDEIPREIGDAEAERQSLLAPHAEWLTAAHATILAELELLIGHRALCSREPTGHPMSTEHGDDDP
jgi:hypothetical protein